MKNLIKIFLFLIFATNNILFAEEITVYNKANAEKCVQGNCVNGQGILTWTDGTKYEGEFKDEKMTGQGTLTHKDYKYVGELKDSLFNGQGTITWPDTIEKYVGEWKDDKWSGQGTFVYANGDKYVGEWKDGKRNGQGTITYADGRSYVGEFKDGKFNGQGTLMHADGEKYVGEFKDGLANGLGTITYPNGDKVVGAFKDHKMNGYGKITFANGNKIVGKWKDGNQVKGETKFIESEENRAKRDTSNDDLYLYDKKLDYYKVYEEDSEMKKNAKNSFNTAARCYNSLSLIDRKKSWGYIYSREKELIRALDFEIMEKITADRSQDIKVSERAYHKAILAANRFVKQNCP